MKNIPDGTKVAPHGLFYMENAEGHDQDAIRPADFPKRTDDERDLSCFALEEEKGESWGGKGATGPIINEARPTL